jgi:hypothetical protein
MTENEALNFMRIEKECINRNCDRNCINCDIVQTVDNLNNAYDMAIKALEEVQQYRAIGTVEELETASKYLRLVKKHGTVGKAIEACAEYEGIGTVEECRESIEKQRRKIVKNQYGTNYVLKAGYCPVCGCGVTARWDYCQCCGQKLNWRMNYG